ncbi:NAD(P)/FAD-dependent oxidoreductase [Pontivivens insulae]|uniref:Glycine oxidase n=1 Tax=Pontivivens insulae TaxID=1639689 RepID=A0A2R8ABJ1_9RHOB|nr:FAD-dependent oxidoreductase [Pontivivens insulae]RED11245.1 glycine/D-amino acid oxidase-like deaminating enzyme [Pontivivens insulae]SPF29582.1 Glycine oxidase [Pontivivens insulae]
MASGQADVIVIGAGVFGLHTALEVRKTGRSVLVLEAAGEIGAGASGGIVGALAPHMPERWTPKKQFQLEALLTLGPLLQKIEAETGLTTGYGASGRITPLLNENMRDLARVRCADAALRWPKDKVMNVLPGDAWPRWLMPEAAPFGLVQDNLSARLYPKQTITALAAALQARGGVLRLNAPVSRVGSRGQVFLPGEDLSADHVVIANGVDGFELLRPHVGEVPGRGEKGQALLLDLDARDLPVIQGKGLYVVPHADGTTGVGSTSEREYEDGRTTDEQLDELHYTARTICPRLGRAGVLSRWAGVRPRANGRDPMIGPVPGAPRLHAMLGGFKIGFGVAHRCAQVVAAGIVEERSHPIPDSFQVSAHLGL